MTISTHTALAPQNSSRTHRVQPREARFAKGPGKRAESLPCVVLNVLSPKSFFKSLGLAECDWVEDSAMRDSAAEFSAGEFRAAKFSAVVSDREKRDTRPIGLALAIAGAT